MLLISMPIYIMTNSSNYFHLLQSSLYRSIRTYTLYCDPKEQIDLAVQTKKCKTLMEVKEIRMNEQNEYLKGYQPSSEKQIKKLVQYYRYYGQVSIIHLDIVEKIMRTHRECQRVIQYCRLKHLLNLSHSNQLHDDSLCKSSLSQSIRILEQISFLNRSQESQLILSLKQKMEKALGVAAVKSILEIDQIYDFSKKTNIFKKESILQKPKKHRQNMSNFEQFINSTNKSSIDLVQNKSTQRQLNLAILNSSRKNHRELKRSRTSKLNIASRYNSLRSTILDVETSKEKCVRKTILEYKNKINKEKTVLKKSLSNQMMSQDQLKVNANTVKKKNNQKQKKSKILKRS